MRRVFPPLFAVLACVPVPDLDGEFSCLTDGDCASGFFCEAELCVRRLAQGAGDADTEPTRGISEGDRAVDEEGAVGATGEEDASATDDALSVWRELYVSRTDDNDLPAGSDIALSADGGNLHIVHAWKGATGDVLHHDVVDGASLAVKRSTKLWSGVSIGQFQLALGERAWPGCQTVAVAFDGQASGKGSKTTMMVAGDLVSKTKSAPVTLRDSETTGVAVVPFLGNYKGGTGNTDKCRFLVGHGSWDGMSLTAVEVEGGGDPALSVLSSQDVPSALSSSGAITLAAGFGAVGSYFPIVGITEDEEIYAFRTGANFLSVSGQQMGAVLRIPALASPSMTSHWMLLAGVENSKTVRVLRVTSQGDSVALSPLSFGTADDLVTDLDMDVRCSERGPDFCLGAVVWTEASWVRVGVIQDPQQDRPLQVIGTFAGTHPRVTVGAVSDKGVDEFSVCVSSLPDGDYRINVRCTDVDRADH